MTILYSEIPYEYYFFIGDFFIHFTESTPRRESRAVAIVEQWVVWLPSIAVVLRLP